MSTPNWDSIARACRRYLDCFDDPIADNIALGSVSNDLRIIVEREHAKLRWDGSMWTVPEEPGQGSKVTLAQARDIAKSVLQEAEQRRDVARDSDPDSRAPFDEEPGQGNSYVDTDPWAQPLPSEWVEELPLDPGNGDTAATETGC